MHAAIHLSRKKVCAASKLLPLGCSHGGRAAGARRGRVSFGAMTTAVGPWDGGCGVDVDGEVASATARGCDHPSAASFAALPFLRPRFVLLPLPLPFEAPTEASPFGGARLFGLRRD